MLQRRLGLADEQKRRMAVAYRSYANKMQSILQQRQQLQAALLVSQPFSVHGALMIKFGGIWSALSTGPKILGP